MNIIDILLKPMDGRNVVPTAQLNATVKLLTPNMSFNRGILEDILIL